MLLFLWLSQGLGLPSTRPTCGVYVVAKKIMVEIWAFNFLSHVDLPSSAIVTLKVACVESDIVSTLQILYASFLGLLNPLAFRSHHASFPTNGIKGAWEFAHLSASCFGTVSCHGHLVGKHNFFQSHLYIADTVIIVTVVLKFICPYPRT